MKTLEQRIHQLEQQAPDGQSDYAIVFYDPNGAKPTSKPVSVRVKTVVWLPYNGRESSRNHEA